MFKWFSAVPLLARRFVLSKASDGFLSLITWISVVGVALGVMSLTVVTSVINGFEGELAHVITGMNGDLVLYSRDLPVKDPEAIEAKIRKIAPSVLEITRALVSPLMVSGPHGPAGAIIEGVDLATFGKVTTIPQHVIAGRLPQDAESSAANGAAENPLVEVALGSSLADRIGAKEGAEIRVLVPSAGAQGGSTEVAPKSVKAKVVGLVKMGMYEYDSKFMFLTLAGAQVTLSVPGQVTSFKLKLPPETDAPALAEKLSDSFGYPFRAKDWAQLNKNLLYAIKLQKIVIAIILTVIVLVSAFNVVSTLMMMIHDKTKEIAILKAMGFRKAQSFRLFVLIGMGMGAVGALSGVGLGLGLAWVIRKTRLIELPSDIYYIGFLPVVVRWSEIALIGAATLLIAFLATIYPAWRVARSKVLDGLRYE
ncbi:FtsX-like permease family protein [Bdellovibrionota bacterium FG-2]